MDGDFPTLIKSTCPYCGTGCGVTARRSGDQTSIEGDQSHPGNLGKLCVKGSALGETLGMEGRLLHPLSRDAKSADPHRVSWDAALEKVAAGFTDIIDKHGPDAVAWYVSGQLLTEDYYVANKLAKGFVGTANIDTNSRLCMSSAVAGHKRAFGEDIVPVSYQDLEQADLVVLVGSNTAWCHPILFQRIVRAKQQRPHMKLVVIDPRRTATTEMADLHLPVRPGTDVWLFNGLLSYLREQGKIDQAFVDAHTSGFGRALAIAENTAGDLRSVAQQCKLQQAALEQFYQWFAQTPKTISAFSMGVNQSSSGTDKVNSIINCHLATGRIGKAGAGPFSITGQPNAMGGREVGGLSNMLAAHMDLGNAEHQDLVQGFWNSPRIAERPGLKAVDLFQAIEAGKVKALWIMATNPVVSLPDADQVKRALQKCELVVASEVMTHTDTSAFADVLLPALAWGEKDGSVTNSERCISRQRAFLPAPGEARADWWALAQVARRMGYADGFDYQSPHQIFDEHCRLTAHRNAETEQGGVPRYLNLAALSGISREAYDALEPQRWPLKPGQTTAPPVFADGRFYTPDRRARFVATTPRGARHATGDEFPLVLNTGRVRDHWHTMTRTGLSPRLASHVAEPFVDLHPQDALLCGVRDRALARVRSRWGQCLLRVRLSGEMPRGQVFVPIHWNGQFASDARVGALVNPVVDPFSGEPEFKHTPVTVEPFLVSWHGFSLSRGRLPLADSAWWTRITGAGFQRYEFAGRRVRSDWNLWARQQLGAGDERCEWLEYQDPTAGIYRGARVLDGRLEACIFVSPRQDLPSRAWLSQLIEKDQLDEADRAGLLVGEPLRPETDTGETICSCYGVGRKSIEQAIRKGAETPAALGEKLRCGTNCGSCVPELKAIIAESLATAV
ncbi:MAG: molybdopterin-dependent oxidoreductase [Panacagrimonas sp.]